MLLPLTYTTDELAALADGRRSANGTNLRVIHGVGVGPPAPGELWPGTAMRAGIDLATLFHGEPAAAEVAVIDVAGVADPRVRNTHEPRESCPVVLRTTADTALYWGRPPRSQDFLVEARTEDKLANLREAHRQYLETGRWPAWVDLRIEDGLKSRH